MLEEFVFPRQGVLFEEGFDFLRQVGLVEERPDIVIQMHTVNALVADALSGEKRESPAAFDYGL